MLLCLSRLSLKWVPEKFLKSEGLTTLPSDWSIKFMKHDSLTTSPTDWSIQYYSILSPHQFNVYADNLTRKRLKTCGSLLSIHNLCKPVLVKYILSAKSHRDDENQFLNKYIINQTKTIIVVCEDFCDCSISNIMKCKLAFSVNTKK